MNHVILGFVVRYDFNGLLGHGSFKPFIQIFQIYRVYNAVEVDSTGFYQLNGIFKLAQRIAESALREA